MAVGAMATGIAASGCSDQAETTRPVYRQISESVYASVTVQPENLYEVFVANPGIIEQIHIEEGDRVVEGQIIAQIRAENPRLKLDNARLRYDLAREQYSGDATALQNIAEEIALTENQARLDSQNMARQKRLWARNIGSQLALENAELRYESTARNLEILRTRYDLTKTELESALNQAQIALQQAEELLEEHTVTSRLDGCVYEVMKEEGEQVLVQQPIARIGMCSQFILELLIDEVDIARISEGQLALVNLEAYGDEVFESTVQRIYPTKNMRTQTFLVEARFIDPPEALYAGLAGEANIVIATRERALTIPVEYLAGDNSVVTSEGEVQVVTGMRNLEYVEILEGVDTAFTLLKPPVK